MAVTRDDVRHIADLARLGVSEARLDDLVRELNGILAHMEVLAQVDTGNVDDNNASTGIPPLSTPLREDSSGPILLMRPLESFAPATRDGFIIVPRLASHVVLAGAGEVVTISIGEAVETEDHAALVEEAEGEL